MWGNTHLAWGVRPDLRVCISLKTCWMLILAQHVSFFLINILKGCKCYALTIHNCSNIVIRNHLDWEQKFTTGNLIRNTYKLADYLELFRLWHTVLIRRASTLWRTTNQSVSIIRPDQHQPDIHYRHGYQVHLFSPPFVQGDMKPSKRPNSCPSHSASCQSPTVNLDFSDSAGVGEQVLAIISHSHPVFDAAC